MDGTQIGLSWDGHDRGEVGVGWGWVEVRWGWLESSGTGQGGGAGWNGTSVSDYVVSPLFV